jgi:hypothetical protein
LVHSTGKDKFGSATGGFPVTGGWAEFPDEEEKNDTSNSNSNSNSNSSTNSETNSSSDVAVAGVGER